MLRLILEKYYLIDNQFVDSHKIFAQSTDLYFKSQRFYLPLIGRDIELADPKTYPSRKAFRQVLPEILELKRDLKIFRKLWNAFEARHREIKIAFNNRKFCDFINLIKHDSVAIFGNNKKIPFSDLINLISYGFSKIYQIYEKLHEYRESLQLLDSYTKEFAVKYATANSTAIDNDKQELFEIVSKAYKRRDFLISRLFIRQYIETRNFETGEHFYYRTEEIYYSYEAYENKMTKKQSLLYDKRTEKGECVCDLAIKQAPIIFMLDCPICKKPYDTHLC
ncbi:MAG: hypothetical protein QNJ72_35655 [Pleurocapsa sp. MO_226.B13]|nr:hypothetical protein [Pleurocapsa sp. MO_226.B13]